MTSSYRMALFLLVVILLPGGLSGAEWTDEQIEEMAVRAEATVQKAQEFIWQFRIEHDLADTARDPLCTGLIGVELSPLTTTLGYADSKYLSIHPGWASWIVRDLAQRGLWYRAQVAVSFSGSFPAVNLAVLAALQELGSDVKGICSVGASSWGANETSLSWPEMERLLREEGILKIGCSAVTLGGTGDRGLEWDDRKMTLAMQAVKRSRLPFLNVKNLRNSIKKRLLFYGDPADYVIFINVGGGQATLGGGAHPRFQQGGWYFSPLEMRGDPDGVMDAFLKMEIPCLNFLQLEELNHKYQITDLK